MNRPGCRWRLIVDGPASGEWNMAVDRAILASHAAGDGPPTLRLYRWSPPAVSLGRFQSTDDVDMAYCAAEGLDVCRRPTGGRGVLHDDELTYAIVAGVADGLPRGVRRSYTMLCEALAEAYRTLGVDASLTARDRGERGSGACYLHATSADLSLGAAKLSGSAQVWSGDSCLQHGSFIVDRDVIREARVFMLDEERARALESSTATIAGTIARRPSWGEIETAVADAVRRVFEVTLERAALSDAEIERARRTSRDHVLRSTPTGP
jgi:lipoate-protein ligase A